MFFENYIHTLLSEKKKASKETADLYARAIAAFSGLEAGTEDYTESQLVDHYLSFEMNVQRSEWAQVGLRETHFSNAWLLAHAPPYPIENEQIKTNITITQAKNLYSKYHVPMDLLLYHVKCAKCPKEDEVMNVWQSIHKSLKLEKGITVDEGVFETAALR